MGRAPCCEKVGLRKGRWTAEEDEILTNYIQLNGEGLWRSLPKNAGLLRCGKSCRLRWLNYLRADVKRGNITSEEEDVIIRLHSSLGNRWSLIAGHLPGRTDNEIKNYWNSRLSRKIHSFTRVGNEALLHTSYMNLTENMVGTCKRKRDQISRSAMKKNKHMFPNMRKPEIIDQSLAKKTANPTTSNIIGQVGASGLHNNEMLGQFDERSSVVSWPCEGSTSAFMLCPSNEGPYQDEGLDGEIMCLEDILGSGVMDDASEFLSLNDQERDNGEQPGQVTTSDGRSGESGVWSSNTRTGDSYTCSSSMTDGLLNWDWLWDSSANGEGCYI